MRRRKLTALPKAVLYYWLGGKNAGWSFCEGWESCVIEESWRKTSPDIRPFRDFRHQRWYEIKWLIYVLRWARSKWAMMRKYPRCRTYISWGCGEPWAAVNRKTGYIVWKAPWAKSALEQPLGPRGSNAAEHA
jgi:hypothetical protein